MTSGLAGLVLGLALARGEARAAERPLLVVVEAPPALAADAGEIRRAIGTELRAPTVAPMTNPSQPPDRALIVALDGDRIAMSLRSGTAAPVERVIAAPPEHTARLRAIAWLAGNLARDQVSELVAQTPLELSPAPVEPSPVVPAPTTPEPAAPPTVPPPAAASGTPTIATRASGEKPGGASRWSIGVSDGPITNAPVCSNFANGLSAYFCTPLSNGITGSAWRAEAWRRVGANGFFLGAAIGGTTGALSPQLFGAAGLVGTTKYIRRWGFEAVAGVGLEAAQTYGQQMTALHSSQDGFVSSITTSNEIRPGLYADGAIGVSHPVADSLDLFFRLGLHTTTVDFGDWFLSTALGLRYNLP